MFLWVDFNWYWVVAESITILFLYNLRNSQGSHLVHSRILGSVNPPDVKGFLRPRVDTQHCWLKGAHRHSAVTTSHAYGSGWSRREATSTGLDMS